MTHNSILLSNICLSFPHKICFNDFSTEIHSGEHIAIIGNNGSGKSSLLKIIQEQIKGNNFGYIPQIIDEFDNKSGAEKFNKALSQTLAFKPDILLLDEPTNHLDLHNRKSFFKMISKFAGTLIIATHDTELIKNYVNILWHIDNGKICVFKGNYDDYMREILISRAKIEHKLSFLNSQKSEIHQSLMREQQRAKNSKKHGEKNAKNNKWPRIVSDEKARKAAEVTGKKNSQIDFKKQELNANLAELKLPKIIRPKFTIPSAIINKTIISITDGNIAYDKLIITDINLSIVGGEHIAITGNNGSGKSSLIKAILNDPKIKKSGNWFAPVYEDIGYLDQHYNNVNSDSTILEEIIKLVPNWTIISIRKHLNDFLFKKNEEVNIKIKNLSGGERARFSLSLIAAKIPKLLMLDEITNNIDLQTKEHIIQTLKEYPGAMIIISHDIDFLKQINIDSFYEIKNGVLSRWIK